VNEAEIERLKQRILQELWRVMYNPPRRPDYTPAEIDALKKKFGLDKNYES
jgi:hypothetical protein